MNGFDNEYDFVLEINNKKISNINPILYDLIHSLYNNISDDMTIKSWRNHYKQKTDIYIKINNIQKRISIKMGSRNSVHVESINTFISFLKNNHIPENIIKLFLKYHYADGTYNGTGIKRISSNEYKEKNYKEIEKINKYFNNLNLINKIVDRTVIKGLVFNDNIDVIICGTPNDFIWILKEEIKRIILSKKDDYCSAPHFGPLVCQPLNRCLNHNKKYEYGRNYIQIKWYSLEDNIIENMNINAIKASKS